MTNQLTSNPPFDPVVNTYIDEQERLAREADAEGVLTSPYHLTGWPVAVSRTVGILKSLHDTAYAGSAREARAFIFECQRIANDRRLSSEGEFEKRQRTAEPHLEMLERFKNDLLKRAQTTLDAKAASMGATPAADVPTAMRHQAIWTWYERLDDSRRLDEVGKALDGDDQETLQALVSAPKVFAFMGPELRARIESTMLERRFPSQFGELNDLRGALAVASESVDNAVRFIRAMADRPDFEAATHRMQLQAFRAHARG